MMKEFAAVSTVVRSLSIVEKKCVQVFGSRQNNGGGTDRAGSIDSLLVLLLVEFVGLQVSI